MDIYLVPVHRCRDVRGSTTRLLIRGEPHVSARQSDPERAGAAEEWGGLGEKCKSGTVGCEFMTTLEAHSVIPPLLLNWFSPRSG